MIEVKQIVRIFKYQQLELADPGRELSPEQVVEFYSGVYPELVKATVEGPELQGTREIYRMERAVGRKGGEKSPPRPITIKEIARGGKEETQQREKEEEIRCAQRILTVHVLHRPSGSAPSTPLPSELLPLLL